MNSPDPIIAPIPRVALRTDAAAEALDVSPRTLAEWRKQNIGPPFVVRGSVVLYGTRELADWLTAQSQVAAGTE